MSGSFVEFLFIFFLLCIPSPEFAIFAKLDAFWGYINVTTQMHMFGKNIYKFGQSCVQLFLHAKFYYTIYFLTIVS